MIFIRAHGRARFPCATNRFAKNRAEAALLIRAIFFAIVSAILTALIIIVAFVSALLNLAHEYGVALLFISALVTFCVALINLARETRMALNDNDLRS